MSNEATDKRLKGMLARIFSDGVLDPSEREELQTLLRAGTLTPETIRATMSDFLRTTFKQVVADGVISDSERKKLGLIVNELALPDECVPDDVKRAIKP